MKKLLFGLILLLALAESGAWAQCINLVCSNKTVECGSSWTFDPPTIIDLCGCGTNYSLSIIGTSTNASTAPCVVKAQQVWQVIDCGGGASVCSQTVTIQDT